MQVLSYYQVTRPRKVKIRVVAPHEHMPYLDGGNVIDIRAIVQGSKPRFGSSFFLSPNERQITEYEAWQKLNRRLRKRLVK